MLTQKETKQLVKLLGKIKNSHLGLPQEVFEALVRLVPFVSCELVITNRRKEILLTYRYDKWWRGWHFPGGLMRLHESFEERIKKTAQAELGARVKSFSFLFPVNYNRGPRGHAVSLVFLCKIRSQPKDGKFFKTMPRDIIPEHRTVWRQAKPLI